MPPAVTTSELAALKVDAIFAGELFDEGFAQRRNAVHELVFVVLVVGEEVRNAIDRLLRGRVMDHPLTERDRARMLANPFADYGDDRGLDELDAL